MNTEEANSTQVARITIDGLFGLYNHVIPLNKTDRITIVHGPNGVGKTVLFKLTDALLNMRLLELLKYPFQRFEVLFTNGVRIEVMGGQQDTPKTIAQYENDKRVGGKISLAPQELKKWLKNRPIPFSVEQSFHERLIENWFDIQQKDTFNLKGIDMDLYVQEDIFREAGLYSDVSSHLIATQRLIRFDKSKSSKPSFVRGIRPSWTEENEPVLVETVLSYSRELSKSIESTLTEYGRKSQELDQSFPKRLLQGLIKNFTESEIRERMKSVYARQERLQQLGLMAEAPQAQEIEGQLDDSKRPVMAVYLSDMDKKLQVLEGLADKIEILLTQVNEQFVNKKLVLNEKHELAVRTSQGEDLPVSVLSSGEQHQIVLVYDLLFHVKPNTLVMIDEPELSLHMDWQERFIGNLEKIIAVSNIDIVLATHSPYIVHGHNDLLVPLSADPVAITHS